MLHFHRKNARPLRQLHRTDNPQASVPCIRLLEATGSFLLSLCPSLRLLNTAYNTSLLIFSIKSKKRKTHRKDEFLRAYSPIFQALAPYLYRQVAV